MATGVANRLASQTSPYLLQHADNPVAWYPWGEEALTEARRSGKPILLSIGYSACHWCHVMAHESFEDEETATLMNQLFVNIKVDREERPDLDKIYQVSHQLLTRRPGGWPLTMFLDPKDLKPFFGGTYFPLEPRYGMPSFKQLITQVAHYFDGHHDDIAQQNKRLSDALASLEPATDDHALITPDPLRKARAALGEVFEEHFGGFGNAPKFPHPTNLERLLRDYAASLHARADERSAPRPDTEALQMVVFTMSRMINGGLYDQLGGGFCRYSVDDMWMIPHFEKMLYDNGPLLGLCTQAWQIVGEPLFHRAAVETAQWVMREMQSDDGGYYSTLDADSEGEEGKYYVWTPESAKAVLSAQEYEVVAKRYGLEGPPNFENKHWHLHVYADVPSLAEAMGVSESDVQALDNSARAKLLEAREQRIRPGLDDKVLTAWNALMIRSMTMAGRTLGNEEMVTSAQRAFDFVRGTLWTEGRLLATCKDGRAHLAAYLDDYAFMIDAALELLQTRWDNTTLQFAIELAEVLLEHFEDKSSGGFFFTADDHEQLFHRSKPMADDALPAGNGVAAQMLLRLGHLVGETRYLTAAERTLRNAWSSLSRAPHAHNALLTAIEEYLEPPQIIVLRGTPDALTEWQARALEHYAPRRLSFAIPNEEQDLSGLLAARVPLGDIAAYVCSGHQCQTPITELEQFEATLAAGEIR